MFVWLGVWHSSYLASRIAQLNNFFYEEHGWVHVVSVKEETKQLKMN